MIHEKLYNLLQVNPNYNVHYGFNKDFIVPSIVYQLQDTESINDLQGYKGNSYNTFEISINAYKYNELIDVKNAVLLNLKEQGTVITNNEFTDEFNSQPFYRSVIVFKF